MFVENKSSDTNIFYDYDVKNSHLISEWLTCLCQKIGEYYFYFDGNIKEAKKNIKERMPRFVIINKNIKSNINKLKELGVKNIIVRCESYRDNIYKDNDNFIKYLNDNINDIQQYVKKDLSNYKFIYADDIFRCGDLMALHFFKWCCGN